jgi:hypothetical protein
MMLAHCVPTAASMAWAVLFLLPTTGIAQQKDGADLLETHAKNKQHVLEQLRQISQLTLTRHFGTDFREAWRRILIDGPGGGMEKQDFLRAALQKTADEHPALHQALAALAESHRRLFDAGGNAHLMIRAAADPAFRPFGRHLTCAAARAEMMGGNPAEIQAFQTIFETGQNTRGYVHKLESHAQATEYIYAITDIVYGVMLPSDLEFGADQVTADPRRVQMFYVQAGEVIALHPYVLHSGSLSVEPDRSFSILIYKRPITDNRQVIPLPPAWEKGQGGLKVPGADKFYLTLAELHTDDLRDNHGFITAARPVRLPDWK